MGRSLKSIIWQGVGDSTRITEKKITPSPSKPPPLLKHLTSRLNKPDKEPPVKRIIPEFGLLKENSKKRTKMPTEQEAKPAVVTPSLQQWRSSMEEKNMAPFRQSSVSSIRGRG
ncbi:hypothetical protein TNCV_1005511 [Trichonephila clavipes]|nr:hypothetical protein TNCV_1005511 [Trichonephila clavipes]